MLEPRETDIPALFVVFVVLPLVTYILLGKWNEASKKKERVGLLAQQVAEEAFKAEAMTAPTVIPFVPLPNNTIHQCARCYSPATTRCSRCKSVRYCSGKCQIIHWRQVHKHECQQLESICSNSSSKPISIEEFSGRVSFDGNMDSQFEEHNLKLHRTETTPNSIVHSPVSMSAHAAAASTSMDTSGISAKEKRSIDKKVLRKCNRDILRREDKAICSDDASSRNRVSSSCTGSKEASMRNELNGSQSMLSEHSVDFSGGCDGRGTSTMNESHLPKKQSRHGFETKNDCDFLNPQSSVNNQPNACDAKLETADEKNRMSGGIISDDKAGDASCLSERLPMKSSRNKSVSRHPETKLQKSQRILVKASREHPNLDLDKKAQTAENARIKDHIPVQGNNGVSSTGLMKMIGLMKTTKIDRREPSQAKADRHKKMKMLFPYEEFVNIFQHECFNIAPRGLINCGNSCYANAVLQCLTCTKPLAIYLLRRSHSRACCVKDWCLMCELEQHVMMLRESGGPLSPSRILSHMRSINCQIGDGSQEDAHEFLRLLVASMQSICLEDLGGESSVDPILQETTFIQHTFGGCLRSKVKCLRCHHESERYENIMDLTLEIFGWVESLEDALTQFTSPEDLDGDNMYRCGRCASYVRARKQLNIEEAPNILTIVLKRFQEGSYGKINKCITFPEMLDMIPFMTGTDDIPPLYMLYAVVVHLDTLNASFSGHYISYVKDLQGNWFRIDDTQVQPVAMTQVMTEGAYILFYIRSFPRPARASSKKTVRHQASRVSKQCASKSQMPSRQEENHFSGSEPFLDHRSRPPILGAYAESSSMEFSDATSSDWSLFTSSDEASFTTESTRDSFSTMDYVEAGSTDPISSVFKTLYASNYSSSRTVSCSMFSSSEPQTRFVSETRGYVVDSDMPIQPLDRYWTGENSEQFTPTDENVIGLHVNYGSDPRCGPLQL